MKIPSGCNGCPNFIRMDEIQKLGPCVVCRKIIGLVEYAKKCEFYHNHPKSAQPTKQKLVISPDHIQKPEPKPKLKLKLRKDFLPKEEKPDIPKPKKRKQMTLL